MPKSSAIVITILVTVVSIVALLLLFVWGMSVVGQWLIRNGSQFQTLYPTSTDDQPVGLKLCAFWGRVQDRPLADNVDGLT